jgi:glycerol-3-phosphate dehydrogenase (NAD(P)+)
VPGTLFRHVGVVGAGAWGTALAVAAARAGRQVTLWGRDVEAMAAMAETRAKARALPGLVLDRAIRPTGDAARLGDADLIVLAVPMQATRMVGPMLALAAGARTPIVCTAKGIEAATGLFVTDLVAEVVPGRPAALLSGPSFAVDVAAGLPTAVTLASADIHLARALAGALGSAAFRIYHGDDVRGVEIGGAAKNVIAIAAGIVAGRGLGDSARAALIARGFAELRRFGAAYGARPETLMGLSGLGDLLLTASSAQSRNYALGLRLGGGMALADAAAGKLAEGAHTASVLMDLAKARGIEMPIAGMVDAVLKGWVTIDGALEALLNRPQKAE